MARRAIFLDVDGTLLTKKGTVPDSARRAIRSARARGHAVFLCTGRAMGELWPDLLDIGFDGVVAAAGAVVQAGGDVLTHQHLTDQEVQHVKAFFDAVDDDYYLQSNDANFGTLRMQNRLRTAVFSSVEDPEVRATLENGPFAFIANMRLEEVPANTLITKAVFLGASAPFARIQEEFAATLDVAPASVGLFGANSGEMMPKGVHKAAGIASVVRHLGINMSHTIAIGDSYNDLEMLETVGVGIAMADAPDPILAAADEVTEPPECNGIRNAFVRHHLV